MEEEREQDPPAFTSPQLVRLSEELGRSIPDAIHGQTVHRQSHPAAEVEHTHSIKVERDE
jgi:hypothetical protein